MSITWIRAGRGILDPREAGGEKEYSANLRERLLGAIDAGLSQAEAARLFGVGIS